MNTFFPTVTLVSTMLVNGLAISLHAEPDLRWRSSSDGTIKLQVQDWTKDSAPTVKLSPVTISGLVEGNEAQEPVKTREVVTLPVLSEMSVKGNWQLKSWTPVAPGGEIAEGIYQFSIDDEVVNLDDFEFSAEYQTARGELAHQTGEVSWSQRVPGAVRVLLQFPSGLTVGTIADWQAYAPGQQKIKYDFIGADGVDYRYQPNLRATVQIAPLPNDFFVQGNPETEHSSLPSDNYQLKSEIKKVADSDQEVLRVELTPDTLKQIGTRRFEILIYADGVFVHEESQGVSPYTYILPHNLSTSAKQLTINLLDYEGNWGVQTIQLSK